MHTSLIIGSNMSFQASLLAILALLAGNPLSAQQPPTLYGKLSPQVVLPYGIIGGEEISIEQAPYQVLIKNENIGHCGGSIISKDWVITAAQCVSNPPNSTTVRAGTNSISGGTVYTVAEIYLHEKFNINQYGIVVNDVAVVKISEPFILDKTRQPIELFKQGEVSKNGVSATVTGWGAVKDDNNIISEKLRKVDVPIVEKSECSKIYASDGGLPSGQICAGEIRGGKGVCYGDGGGPLAINGRLAGIVSWGFGCATPGFPAVYTEIAAYNNWVTSKTGLKL